MYVLPRAIIYHFDRRSAANGLIVMFVLRAAVDRPAAPLVVVGSALSAKRRGTGRTNAPSGEPPRILGDRGGARLVETRVPGTVAAGDRDNPRGLAGLPEGRGPLFSP